MATMRGNVGTTDAERHVKTYLNRERLESLRYTLAKRACHLEAGTEITIREIQVLDGVYHAATECGHLIPITRINKPKVARAATPPEAAEDMQIAKLNESIEGWLKFLNAKSIGVWHGINNYHRIARAEKVITNSKKPKADFVLLSTRDVPIVFGSLKAGPEPTDFQQWGGITDYADHNSVVKFVEKLKNRLNGESFPQKISIGMKLNPTDIMDHDLMMKCMFGSDYQTPTYGINNVHLICGGQPLIEKTTNGLFTLNAPLIIHNSQAFDPSHMSCFIGARYCSDRINLGIKNCRIGVFPEGSRKVHEYL